MAKPIITLNGLKIVIMLGMLVVILSGIRFHIIIRVGIRKQGLIWQNRSSRSMV
ncbi:hypothetical protein I4Y75_003051 [Salmonella enterica subsp. enterica serovar Java]|nr:hypothetical protein [Salmonella enterica subsp. enterica serovar Java]